MGPDVFLVGLIGAVVAAVLADRDDEVVAAPTASALGLVPFFLAYLAYGAWTASAFDSVMATWVFGGFVAMAITWAVMLFGGFATFGIIVGYLIWLFNGHLNEWRVEGFAE